MPTEYNEHILYNSKIPYNGLSSSTINKLKSFGSSSASRRSINKETEKRPDKEIIIQLTIIARLKSVNEEEINNVEEKVIKYSAIEPDIDIKALLLNNEIVDELKEDYEILQAKYLTNKIKTETIIVDANKVDN